MGFEPTTLGLGIRLALFHRVPPSGGPCRPVRILASGLSPRVAEFRLVLMGAFAGYLQFREFTAVVGTPIRPNYNPTCKAAAQLRVSPASSVDHAPKAPLPVHQAVSTPPAGSP